MQGAEKERSGKQRPAEDSAAELSEWFGIHGDGFSREWQNRAITMSIHQEQTDIGSRRAVSLLAHTSHAFFRGRGWSQERDFRTAAV
jgi:hypothetical protein